MVNATIRLLNPPTRAPIHKAGLDGYVEENTSCPTRVRAPDRQARSKSYGYTDYAVFMFAWPRNRTDVSLIIPGTVVFINL